MRVLLLSAYDAASHRHWRECLLQELPDWDWTVLTQPARHFSWRIRGNPLSWALQQRSILEAGYDLLLATSMVDLATLRGLVPALASIPAVLYFHENQFAYPPGRGRHGMLEAQMVSLYSALSAGSIVFNSAYNRDSFLLGCDQMLKKFPDGVPASTVSLLQEKSLVLPVPLSSPGEFEHARLQQDPSVPLQILWNHRWEYDKGPELLLEIVRDLSQRHVSFTLHLAGQQFRQVPAALQELRDLLSGIGALGQWGFVEHRQDYLELVQRSDVVLSTALHDFQGLSMLEAAALGCSPLAPDRLAYPEWFARDCLYRDCPAAVLRIQALARMKLAGQALPLADVSDSYAAALIPRYRELLRSQVQPKTVS
jgi:glycosyltransferase involved in cell wall biosynthesis